MTSLTSTLKKATLDPSLQDIFPPPKRNLDHIQNYFEEQGINELVQHVKSQRVHNNRKAFVSKIKMFVNDEDFNSVELINYMKEAIDQGKVTAPHALQHLFATIANSGDWAGSDNIPDDFYKEIKRYFNPFKAIVKSEKLQIEFINKIQEFCYDNIDFIKSFQKIIFLLYQGNVVEEDAIIQWYKHLHSSKGKTQFISQMEKMVHWLENAEEEESDDDDENEE